MRFKRTNIKLIYSIIFNTPEMNNLCFFEQTYKNEEQDLDRIEFLYSKFMKSVGELSGLCPGLEQFTYQANNKGRINLMELVKKIIMTIPFSANSYDILFCDSIFNQALVNLLFCNSSYNHYENMPSIEKNNALLKYINVNETDPVNHVPLYVHICTQCPCELVQEYLPKMNLMLLINKQYSLLSYMISKCETDIMVEKCKLILEFIKLQPEILKFNLSQYPEEWKEIYYPLLKSFVSEDLIIKMIDSGYEFKNKIISVDELLEIFYNDQFELFTKLVEKNINMKDELGYSLIHKIILSTFSQQSLSTHKTDLIKKLLDIPEIDLGTTNMLNESVILMIMRFLLETKTNVSQPQPKFITSKTVENNFAPKGEYAMFPDCFDTLSGPKFVVGPWMESSSALDSYDLRGNVEISKKQTCSTTETGIFNMHRYNVLIEILDKVINNKTCNPNIASVNNDCVFMIALELKDISVIKKIFNAASFDANYVYNDGTTNLIRLIQSFDLTKPLLENDEHKLFALDLLLKNKDVQVMKKDLYDKNAVMYSMQVDNSVLLKKLLKVEIPYVDLDELLKYSTSLNQTANSNLIKLKKSSKTKWLFSF